MAISAAAQAALDQLQQTWGKPLQITSGYRDPARNASVGGAKGSQHIHGNAFDISAAGMSPEERLALASLARDAGFKGFGFYDNSLHFDVGAPRAWGPDYHRGSVPDWAQSWVGQNIGGGGSASSVAASAPSAPNTGMMPMGLLDMQDEPQTFAERLKSQWQSGELKDRIALAANTLRMDPDPNLAAALQGRQQAREERATINKTAQWLALQGREDLAQAMLTGGLDAKSAVAIAMQPADPLAAIQLEKAQIELQNLKEPKPGFRPATAEEAEVYGATSGQIGPDGRFYPGVEGEKPTAMIQNYEYWLSQGKSPEEAQALAKAGAGGVTVDLTGESQGALNKELAKAEAGVISTYLKQGPVAAGAMQDLTLLGEVLQYAPQDPVTGRLAELLPGVSSAGAAASSIIKRVAPTLRAEGSGSTSDIEYAGMLNSLPSLQNYPEANAVILDIMKAKAAVDIERSQVVRDFANSQQTPEDARAMRTRLSEIDSRSIMTPDMRRVIDALSGAAAPGGTGGGNGQPVVIDGVTIQKVN